MGPKTVHGERVKNVWDHKQSGEPSKSLLVEQRLSRLLQKFANFFYKDTKQHYKKDFRTVLQRQRKISKAKKSITNTHQQCSQIFQCLL